MYWEIARARFCAGASVHVVPIAAAPSFGLLPLLASALRVA